jgi:hypothetical protein
MHQYKGMAEQFNEARISLAKMLDPDGGVHEHQQRF